MCNPAPVSVVEPYLNALGVSQPAIGAGWLTALSLQVH